MDKITKLKALYDLSKPQDLFTIVPQEMEVMEIKGIAYGYDGPTKKKAVIAIIERIAIENNIDLDSEMLSVFVDVIDAASKGKYALNKDKS